ncbi:hypothetical protein [Methylobacterium sp. 17Sr1-1]|uniref:hypothetical protein n=1 Tax=Methylobacterium sp. 17Sr1-1 TaxID=2202826 RepID=UPI000D6EB66B|nr:hypothetical protein [Methylobacterium sp. 17Sr1-1]AWN55038.1 hypothetical protein DK412_28300 [Methylobacterium sp. 17Sr1-1]
MHRTLNYLDAEQARYRALNAALAGPLPHLEIADRRAQRDRLDRIPHIDADARARAIRNEVIRGLDEAIASAVGAVAIVAASIGLGAAVHFVGSVL